MTYIQRQRWHVRQGFEISAVFIKMPFQKLVTIDARNHMVGRLCSVVAKELLNGQKVVIVRAEEANISGSLYRNQVIFHRFLQHRTNSQPKAGPFHHRSPAEIIYRTVRGMIPHKTARGAAAMARLKVFEGIPHPYDRIKRQVVTVAIRAVRLKPGRKFCRLGDLSKQVGWAHNELIGRLEAKRAVKGEAYYTTKKTLNNLKAKAVANTAAELADTNKQLAALGY